MRQNMINKFITGVFIIFGLAVCLSELFSRHCVNNDIKILLTGILLFVGVMFISCIYGGNQKNKKNIKKI